MKNSRKLVYVPILHTSSDMGTLAGAMRDNYVQKYGEQKWDEHVKTINGMWKGIKNKIKNLNVPFKKVKIYQDGLPLCGKEKEIIKDLAKKRSPNHILIYWMMKQGAKIIGTEDPQLLLKEYNHIKNIITAKTFEEREKFVHEFGKEETELLKMRDKKIGEQINKTLKMGEIGVLFIGLLHRVDENIPSNILVSYLIHRLPFRRSFEMEMVA